MRIAIYVQDMRASGVVRTMIALGRLFARDHEVHILAGYASGLFGPEDVAPAGFVAANPAPKKPIPRLRVVPGLRSALQRLQPDVVLSGGNFGHFSLWAATRGMDVPVVYTFSNAMERAGQPVRNRWRRFWSGLLVNTGGGAILVGRTLEHDATFREHVVTGNAAVIPNGIDLAQVPAADGFIPAPMECAEPVVLSIGRLQPQKNFEGLIDAVAVARRSRPLRLVVLGTGQDEYRRELQERAAQHGIEQDVVFAGVTENVYPWLRAADVFALASHWEGSSIALLEAMAADTPIVASRHAGDAASVLDEGRFGLIADGRDAEAFAAALLRQIDAPLHPGERVREFDITAMARAYLAMLAAVAARR